MGFCPKKDGNALECRFGFNENLCAHKEVREEECKGHNYCEHFAVPYYAEGLLTIQKSPVKSDKEQGCPDRRFAVYCARVKKFTCKGPKECPY